MFYTVYKITNTINGKIYIGAHRTKNLDDKYMGSGKIIKAAVKKYGLENFTKEVLQIFNNPEDMYEMESVLVNEEFINNLSTYNLKLGGGNIFINNGLYGLNGDDTHGRQNLKDGAYWKNQLIESGRWENHLAKLSNVVQKRYNNGFISVFVTNNPQKTEEGRKKHREALLAINHQQGEKNSQFGTMWITNGVVNKKIKKNSFIPEHWRKGRVSK